MGGEQGEGSPMHHPHLQPHGVIAEGEVVDEQEMANMRTRLAELLQQCAQQQEVRKPGDLCGMFVLTYSKGLLWRWCSTCAWVSG